MSDTITHESLAAGEGQELFAESWTPIQRWLDSLANMEAPLGHKIWAYLSASSMLTNNAQQEVFVPRLGQQTLNLGIVYVGRINTVVVNLIDLVHDIARVSEIPLAPYDTDGHRQGLIQALQGFVPAKRKTQAISIGVKTKKAEKKKKLSPQLLQLQKALMSANLPKMDTEEQAQDPLKAFASTDTGDSRVIDPGEIEFPARPTGMVSPDLRLFLKDAQGDLRNLLVHCLLNRAIDIQQQQHRYVIPRPSLSILAGCRPEDLIGRGGYVNHNLLANIIPVYCALDGGSSMRVPSSDGIKTIKDHFEDLRDKIAPRQQFQLSDEAIPVFHRLAEVQLQTLDLNMAGMADRRVHNLVKIAAILASVRSATTITSADVELANILMLLNESSVNRAYAGLLAEKSDAKIFMRIIEFIEAHGSASIESLTGYLRHITSLREVELYELLNRFLSTGKVHEIDNQGTLAVSNTETQLRIAAASTQLRRRLVKTSQV